MSLETLLKAAKYVEWAEKRQSAQRHRAEKRMQLEGRSFMESGNGNVTPPEMVRPQPFYMELKTEELGLKTEEPVYLALSNGSTETQTKTEFVGMKMETEPSINHQEKAEPTLLQLKDPPKGATMKTEPSGAPLKTERPGLNLKRGRSDSEYSEDEPHRKFTILGPLLTAPRNPTHLLHPPPLLVHAHPSIPSTNSITTTNIAVISSSTTVSTSNVHNATAVSSQSLSDVLSRPVPYHRSTNTPNNVSNVERSTQHYSPSPSSSSSSFPSTSSSPSPSPSGTSKPSTSREERDSPRRGGTGTREVHNKLEKNRRAIMKECFELLRRHLPPMHHVEKKISHLTILHTAVRFIQSLRRRERECEHEMERLAREKIAAQQRLAELKRELTAQWDHLDLNVLLPNQQNQEDFRHERDSHTTSTATAVHEEMISDSEDLRITTGSTGHSLNVHGSSSHYHDTPLSTPQSQEQQRLPPPCTTQTMLHVPQPSYMTQISQSQNQFSQNFPQTIQQCPPLIQLPCPTLVQTSRPRTTLLQTAQSHSPLMNTYQSMMHLGRCHTYEQVSRVQQTEAVISAERIVTSVRELTNKTQSVHETACMNGPLTMTEPPPLHLCSQVQPHSFSFTGNTKPQQPQLLPQTHVTIPVSAHMMNTSGLAATIVNPAIQIIPSTLRVIPQEPQPLALTMHQSAAIDVPANVAQPPQISKDTINNNINIHSRQFSSQVAVVETSRLPTAELSLVSTNGALHGNKLPDGTTVLTSAVPAHFSQATFTHMVTPGLTPIVAPLAVVSQGNQVAHIITTPQIGGKVVTTGPILKSVNAVPIMNAQYLSAATLVKPVVVVSSQSTSASPSQS